MPIQFLNFDCTVQWGVEWDSSFWVEGIELNRQDARELVEHLLEYLEQTGPHPRSVPAEEDPTT